MITPHFLPSVAHPEHAARPARGAHADARRLHGRFDRTPWTDENYNATIAKYGARRHPARLHGAPARRSVGRR
jgi:hypothetical protein